MSVTREQIIAAWYGIEERWFARREKMHSDGRIYEVVHDWDLEVISDETMEVIERFSTHEEATNYAEYCEDHARAAAVMKLFETK